MRSNKMAKQPSNRPGLGMRPSFSLLLLLQLLSARGGGAGQDKECSARECAQWAKAGECDTNSPFMQANCREECAAVATGKPMPRAPPSPPPPCVDAHTGGDCSQWARDGECEANPAFMHGHCAFSCGTCDLIYNYSKRCPTDPNRTAAVPPDRMTCEPYTPPPATHPSPLAYNTARVWAGACAAIFERALTLTELSPVLLSRSPWVVAFDTFLQDAEIEALLRHGRCACCVTGLFSVSLRRWTAQGPIRALLSARCGQC